MGNSVFNNTATGYGASTSSGAKDGYSSVKKLGSKFTQFKVGGEYPDLVCKTSSGKEFTRNGLNSVSMSGLEQGDYTLFIPEEGEVKFETGAYKRQPDAPVDLEMLGTLDWNDGVVNGFATDRYLKMKTYPTSVNKIEMVFGFTYKKDSSSTYQLLTGASATDYKTPQFVFNNSTEVFYFDFSQDGSTWTHIGLSEAHTLEENSDYMGMFSWDKSTGLATFSIAKDGGDYELVGTANQVTNVTWTEAMSIGAKRNASQWKGTIDLGKSYIKINDKLWWSYIKEFTTWENTSIFPVETKRYNQSKEKTVRRYYKYKEFDWVRPNLTSNTSSPEFKVIGCTQNYSSTCNGLGGTLASDAWVAFDGNTSSQRGFTYHANTTVGIWYQVELARPIKITDITWTFWGNDGDLHQRGDQAVVYGSNDNTNWTKILDKGRYFGTVTTSVTSPNYYKYYIFGHWVSGSDNDATRTYEIKPIGKERIAVPASEKDYDYYEEETVYESSVWEPFDNVYLGSVTIGDLGLSNIKQDPYNSILVDRPSHVQPVSVVESGRYNLSNGESWYKLYSDGWCEQGISITTGSSSTGQTFSLPKPLKSGSPMNITAGGTLTYTAKSLTSVKYNINAGTGSMVVAGYAK